MIRPVGQARGPASRCYVCRVRATGRPSVSPKCRQRHERREVAGLQSAAHEHDFIDQSHIGSLAIVGRTEVECRIGERLTIDSAYTGQITVSNSLTVVE